MKYKCLALDHDDTVVSSTPSIHYPSFMKALKVLRPKVSWSLEQYMDYNFEPGFEKMCSDILNFTEEEAAYQEKLWKESNAINHPPAFEGIEKVIGEFKETGGKICVISHSSEDVIRSDYIRLFGFYPDYVYGWERGYNRRKPSAWPVIDLMKQEKLARNEILVVDDMKPGWEMAKKCEVDFAFAGWGNPSDKAASFMLEHASYVLHNVADLEKIVMK